MKLVEPKVELWNKKEGEFDIQFIERVGRVCYKSEDKITEDGESAKKLVGGMFVGHGHGAVLEHIAYVFEMDMDMFCVLNDALSELENTYGYPIYLTRTAHTGTCLVSGNVRAWRDVIRYASMRRISLPLFVYKAIIDDSIDSRVLFEDLFIEDDLNWFKNVECKKSMTKVNQDCLSDEDKKYHYYQTVKFTCDRGVTHEIVRHRPASYAQESTRYCNYSWGKFDGECSFIDISGGLELDKKTSQLPEDDKLLIKQIVENVNKYTEDAYNRILKLGGTPQIARDVLPGGLKTELVMTANLREWKHFLDLRADSAAHPQMREVSYELQELFDEKFNWNHIFEI